MKIAKNEKLIKSAKKIHKNKKLMNSRTLLLYKMITRASHFLFPKIIIESRIVFDLIKREIINRTKISKVQFVFLTFLYYPDGTLLSIYPLYRP